MGSTAFIADCHFNNRDTALSRKFDQFIQEHAPQFDAIYILGDLFEVCYGNNPDDACMRYIAQQLASVVAKGIPVFYMVGNRDFMIPKHFITQSHVTLIPELYLVNLYGTPTLLAHGDTFCRSDRAYLRFRRIVRNPLLQFSIRSLPLFLRHKLAMRVRAKSNSNNMKMMDVCGSYVTALYEKYHVQRIIHGHTHIPTIHLEQLPATPHKRICLSDWGKLGNFLTVNAERSELHYF